MIHWSSVKEFSCLKATGFALETDLKFWPLYMKSRPCSSLQFIKIFYKYWDIAAICHDSSLKRRRM